MLKRPEHDGKAYCTACCPEEFNDGSKTGFSGRWHNRFDRVYANLKQLQEDIDNGETRYQYFGKFQEEMLAYIKQKSAQT